MNLEYSLVSIRSGGEAMSTLISFEKIKEYEDNDTLYEGEVYCTNKNGVNIGNLSHAYAMHKHGIDVENMENHYTGFSPKEQKWYGWSHRARYGFGIGDSLDEGDAGYNGKKFTAKTIEDAKEMAFRFADSVS